MRAGIRERTFEPVDDFARSAEKSAERPAERSPLRFLILLFILSAPFWLAGNIAEQQLPLPFSLPAGALVLVCPMVAALILIYREEGSKGIKRQFRRCFDYKRIKAKVWYLPIFLLMPFLMALEYAVMKLTGMPVPDPQYSIHLLPVFFALFFIGGIGEEIGWTGYATDPLQARRSAFRASIILGIVWAVWHMMPYIQGHNAPIWLLAQSGATVVLRVLVVWIYNNTGKSLFAAVAFHASSNLSELVLFPIYGSHYDPVIAFALLAITAAAVVILWGPETLARYRYASYRLARSRP